MFCTELLEIGEGCWVGCVVVVGARDMVDDVRLVEVPRLKKSIPMFTPPLTILSVC